ncbi:MAG: hypothetical protein C0501_06750 [Isosphaera sp.]|nr:hypothetical protein [Isosphaera sp.]
MNRLFLLVGACAPAVAAGSAPTPPPPDPAALVRQLGSDRYDEREAAAAALEKIGPPAAKALADGAASEHPEVRERAAVLLGKVRRAADSAARLAPKRVALDYQDAPLGTALNDLKARTGLNLALDPDRVANPLRRVTCRTAEVPAWEAVEAFCAAAGLREVFRAELDIPKPVANPRRGYTPPPPAPLPDAVPVVLVDGKGDRLPGDRSTPVRVLALPPSFGGHRATIGTGEVELCLDVTPAPGFGWQEVTGVKVVRVTDAAGRAGSAGVDREARAGLLDALGWAVFAQPGNGRVDLNGNPIPPDAHANPRVYPVPLKLATPSARSLRRLEGVVYGEVQLANQVLVTVDEPGRQTSTGFAGPGELRVTVLEVTAGSAGPPGRVTPGRARVQLEFPSPYALAMRKRGWNPFWPEPPQRPGQGYRVEAFDAAGGRFPVTNTQSADMSDDGMTLIQVVTLTYQAGSGVPARLVVVGPKTVTVQVPFAMENVPLP